MNSVEIKEIRLKLGLSQEAFAHAIGVACVTMNRWENGHSLPSRLAIEKMKTLRKAKDDKK